MEIGKVYPKGYQDKSVNKVNSAKHRPSDNPEETTIDDIMNEMVEVIIYLNFVLFVNITIYKMY